MAILYPNSNTPIWAIDYIMSKVLFELPIKTVIPANSFGHWNLISCNEESIITLGGDCSWFRLYVYKNIHMCVIQWVSLLSVLSRMPQHHAFKPSNANISESLTDVTEGQPGGKLRRNVFVDFNDIVNMPGSCIVTGLCLHKKPLEVMTTLLLLKRIPTQVAQYLKIWLLLMLLWLT